MNFKIASTYSRQQYQHGGVAVIIKNNTIYKNSAWFDEHVEEINFEAAGIELVEENVEYI